MDGLVKEIKPRLSELKIQVDKINEKQNLIIELQKLCEVYYGINLSNLEREKNILVKQKDELKKKKNDIYEKENEIKNELDKANQKRSQNNFILQKLSKELAVLNQEENKYLREKNLIEGRIELLKEKKEFYLRVEMEKVDLNYIEKKLDEILTKIETYLNLKDLEKYQLIELKNSIINLKKESKEGKTVDKNKEKVENLDAATATEKQKLSDISEELNRVKEQKFAKRDELNLNRKEKSEEGIYEKQRELNDLVDYKERLSDKINEIEIKIARLETKKENLIESIPKSVKIDLGQKSDFDLSVDLNMAKEKIDKIRSRLNYIEEIDVDIIFEYKKVKKRYDFLTSESEDITNSVNSLKKIIEELESDIALKFDKTFDKINENFNKFFNLLFKGGGAKLIKIYEENENTGKKELKACDLEIDMPRKKINSLSMLSGGEKTMTSNALLFAMIKSANPPFVFLDEVDAALDEVNSDRFAEILSAIAKQTQVIIVTHNREIMNRCELLYGVTMDNDGISKLVSVDLGDE